MDSVPKPEVVKIKKEHDQKKKDKNIAGSSEGSQLKINNNRHS